MKQLFAIIKKEFKSYIDHPMAYILAVVFLVLNAFLFFRTGLAQEVASLRSMFGFLPWIFIFFISALTMRSWAEERKEKTLSILLSYPVKIWKLVLGKFLATWFFVALVLVITLFIPIGLSQAGSFDWGVVFSQYLGALMLASVMIAIGQWASTLTKNQVVAFILSAAIQAAFYFVGIEIVVISLSYPFNTIAQQLGLLSHFSSMSRGVIDLRDVIYFISVSFIFLSLAYLWLVKLKSKANSAVFRKLQTSIVIFIAIAIVVNLFGQTITARVDLTNQKLYSLSSATKVLLNDLDDTVRLTLYRSKKLPTQVELVGRDVLDILNDYGKFGGRHVDIAIKFPDVDEEVAKEAQANGIPSIQFNIHREDEFTLQEGYLGVVIEYLDEKESLPFVSSINDLEFKLTSAILKMQTDNLPRLGFLSDFGGKSLAELAAIQAPLQESFIVEQIVLEPEEGQELLSINEQIDVLFISAPTQPYTEAALAEVSKYVDRGGKVLWMLSGVIVDDQTLNGSANTTGLESILSQQGVTINKDIVADLASHQNVTFGNGLVNYVLPYPYWIVAGLKEHQLAGNVSQVMMSWPSSLSLEEKDNIKPVVVSTQNAVVQTANFALNPDSLPDFSQFSQGERVLAATVEEIEPIEAVPAGRQGEEKGRWFVLAGSRFLDAQILSQSPQNATLILNGLDWLTQNDALLSIRSKNSAPSVLIWESKSKQKAVVWGNTVGAPVLIVILGSIWILRRKRKTKRS